MNGDKPKFSLLDWIANSSTTQNPISTEANVDSLFSTTGLQTLELERKKRQELKPKKEQIGINFNGGHVTYDYLRNPLEERDQPLVNPHPGGDWNKPQDPTIITRQGNWGVNSKQKKVEDIKSVGKSSKLINALDNGLWQGIGQNIDLLTGYTELGAGQSEYNISRDELNELKDKGYISQEEYDNYIKNRNALPLLTTITASLTNSLMIAGEIGLTAPTAAFSLGKESAKFFTKEGLKRYGKEIVTQAKNSYRIMGPGANIRAAKDSYNEIKDLKDASVDDVLGIIGKNVAKNNIEALMEGASEGLIRDLRYANVSFKSLSTALGWKNLATNIGKKSLSGLVFETATEQVTDITSDILSGNNVFTQGSNALNILFGEDDSVKKQALENLFVEAVTGMLLGTSLGYTDFFRGSLEKNIAADVRKGKYTLEEGQAILDLVKDKAILNNAINVIQRKNKQGAWSETAKSVAQGLSNFQRFGLNENPDLKISAEDQQSHDEALKMTQDNFVYNLVKVSEKLEEATVKEGITPNILDQAILLGQEQALSYLQNRSDIEGDVDYVTPFTRDDKAYNLPIKIIHQVTEQAQAGMMAASGMQELTEKLAIPESLPQKVKTELHKDLVTAIFSNFGDQGYVSLKAKWKKAIDEKELDAIINNAKSLHSRQLTNAGARIMGTAFDSAAKEVDDYFAQIAIAKEEKRESKNLEQLENIESIGADVVDGYLNEARAFHGSPYNFEKFDKGKIGTGEGAQAYGYGLYFSTKKGIAKWYAEARGPASVNYEVITAEGVTYKDIIPIDEYDLVSRELELLAIKFKDLEKNKEKFNKVLDEAIELYTSEVARYEAMTEDNHWTGWENNMGGFERLLFIVSIMRGSPYDIKLETVINGRNLYKVKLWEGKEQNLLDWDNKIPQRQVEQFLVQLKKENPELTDKRIKELKEYFLVFGDYGSAGYKFYELITGGFFNGSEKLTSEFLNRAGFDGIQYRGKTSGEINYVVFDDSQINIEEHKLYQRPNQKTQSLNGTYEELLQDFNGKTVGELFNYVENKNLIQESLLPVYKLLLRHIKDIPVEVTSDNMEEYPGRYLREFEGGPKMIINPSVMSYSPYDLGNTTLHEALHAFTADFLASGTEQAQAFRADLDAIRADVNKVLTDPHKAIKDKIWVGKPEDLLVAIARFGGDMKHYNSSAEEFLAGVLSDTTKLRGVMMRISSLAGNTVQPVTAWDRVRNAFKIAWQQILPSDKPTLFDNLIDTMTKYHKDLETYHGIRRKHISNLSIQEAARLKDAAADFHGNEFGLMPGEEYKELDLDPKQIDEDYEGELQRDLAETKGFVSLMALINNLSIPEMRSKIRNMGSVDAFRVWIKNQPEPVQRVLDDRLEELFDRGYKYKQENLNEFKERFITGTFNSIINRKSMPHINVVVNVNGNDVDVQVNRLGDTFRRGDGTMGDSYVGTVVLEDFINPLRKILNLDGNQLNMVYVAGFEQTKRGKFFDRSTLKRLTRGLLGQWKSKDPVAKILARYLWAKKFIYPGNFGGRNTSIAFEMTDPTQVIKALTPYISVYLKGMKLKTSDTWQYGQVLRLMLEDMWYGVDITDLKNLEQNSKVLNGNINKIWKRGMKFMTIRNQVWDNPDVITKKFGDKKFSGIAFKNGELVARAVTFNSDDDGSITVTANGEKITVPLSLLLRNESADHTPRTDGATFYLLNEFDEVYHTIHGTFKDGTIKNVYASSLGEKPLYIKHAMHGVSAGSLLGQFMKKHNIALLMSDQAVKEGANPITLSQHWDASVGQDIPSEQVLELPVSKFQRIKEELGTDTVAGTIKQWLNGSGHGSYNPVIKSADADGKYDQHLSNLAQRITENANKEILEKSQPTELYQVLKSIVEKPEGPNEENISTTYKQLMQLPEEQFLDQFGNLFNIPLISEALRQRLFRIVDSALQARIAGMRAALGPDIGILNAPANVDPIENDNNLTQLAINLASEDGMLSELFPEPGLGKLALAYLELQRIESIANANNDRVAIKKARAARERIIDEIKLMSDNVSEERRNDLISGNIYRAVAKSDKVKAYKQQILKRILEDQTKTLKEGWVIISEDCANKMGVKAGDKIILQVTPTDSPLGIMTARVAGIAPAFKGRNPGRKVADRMRVVLNSNYIQTIVGKDYDIDTIALIPYNRDYWTRDQYEAVWKTITEARTKFIDKVTRTTRNVLNNNEITNESAFTVPIREAYCQKLMGAAQVQEFNVKDSFWELNDAYLVDPSPIIVERLYHSAMSAIGASSQVNGMKFNINNPDWFTAHQFHLIDTNFSVDFPGQLSKLTYTSDPAQLFDLRYGQRMGESYDEDGKTKYIYQAINKANRFLFATAFDLAASRDTELNSKPTYYRLVQMIKEQQAKLKLLKENPLLLGEHFRAFANEKAPNMTENQRYIVDLAVEYIQNFKLEDVNSYPLFAAINNLKVTNYAMPGSSFEDWLIDQAMVADDLLESSNLLNSIYQNRILGEAETHKKNQFMVNKRTFAQEEARNLIFKYAKYVNGVWNKLPEDFKAEWKPKIVTAASGKTFEVNRTDVEKADLLVAHHTAMRIVLANIPDRSLNTFKREFREYAALRAYAGKPFPVDAIRGGQEWNIMHKAIALSLLPREVDFYNYVHKENYQNRSEAVVSEIISLLHAFREIESTENSPEIKLNRWGRSVAFPQLVQTLLKAPRVSASIKEISLKWGDKIVKVSPSMANTLLFEFNGQLLEGHELEKAEGWGSELYKALTETGELWEGVEPNDVGTKNRIAFSELINFSDNIKVEDRLVILEKHIQKRLYSGGSTFGLAPKHAIWISLMAQSTNLGIKDKKLQGLIIRRDMADSKVKDNFRANELLYRLLSKFEPSLFNRAMNAYSDINATQPRHDQELGVQAMTKSIHAAPAQLNQKRFDENNIGQKSRHLAKLLVQEINEIQNEASRKEFKKAIKENGYNGGLSYIKNMVKRTTVMNALASSEVWYGDLVRDLARLSANQFAKKYNENVLGYMYEFIKAKTDEFNAVANDFEKEQIAPRGSDVAALEGLWYQVKAVEKLAAKGDEKLTKIGKKILMGEMSYPFLGPIKEKKIWSFFNPKDVIGTIFAYDGPRELLVEDMNPFNKVFPTKQYNAVGESSKAVLKQQAINTSINRYQIELNDQVKSMEEVINLISNVDLRKDYMSETSTKIDSPRVSFLRETLGGLKVVEGDTLLLHKEIFELAESLTEKTKIQVLKDEQGRVLYRRGEYYNYDKHNFLKSITTPSFVVEGGQVKLKPLSLSSLEKMKLLAALDIREMYDVKVPEILQKALAYIEATRMEIINGQDYGALSELDAIRERYIQYLEAIDKNRGSYMPHMFASHSYKYAWGSKYADYLKNMVASQFPKLHPKSKEFAEKLSEVLDREYRMANVGEAGNYVIPNFLPRRSPDKNYKKATLDMHFHYINHLANGLKNDLLYMDYLSYQYNARRTGERSSLIEYTKAWYGDQMNNKMMHTKPLEISKIKRGMEINFITKGFVVDQEHPVPIETDLQVWGVVDKITDDKVYLKVNRQRLEYEIKRDLEGSTKYLAYLNENGLGNEEITNRQAMTIKKLLRNGHLTTLPMPLEKMTIVEALETIIVGMTHLRDNIDSVGVYDISDLQTYDLRGVKTNKVNRYMRKGAIGYLDAKKREADNLRNVIGEWDSKIDAAHYWKWKVSRFVGGMAVTAPKLALSLLTMGMFVSPNALATNAGGAFLNNVVDAPYTNNKYIFKGMTDWAAFRKTKRSSMNEKQKKWYDTFASLGLVTNDDMVSIALEAGNISDLDLLSDKGFLSGIKYLAAAAWAGEDYSTYIKEMNRLRLRYLAADELARVGILNKMTYLTEAWRAKVEGRIKNFKKEITPTKQEIAAEMKTNPGLTADNAEERIRLNKLIEIRRNRNLAIKEEVKKGTYKDVANIADEEKMRRSDVGKLALKFLGQNFMTGWFGLGLQAKAEVQRRPAYYIGYRTALDAGFSEEEAAYYGINSISYRHAFYGPAYRQPNANTKAGAFLHQYVQYTYNAFTHWFNNTRQAIPQFLENWTRMRYEGHGRLYSLLHSIFDRKFDTKYKTKDGDTIQDINIMHRMMLKSMITFSINQAGARLFYGLSNWTDPMLQLSYRIMDAITGDGDDQDEEWYETALLVADTLFFWLGLPYKLAMQYVLNDPEDNMVDTYYKGRVEDQAEFIARVKNEISTTSAEERLYLKSQGEKFFGDVPWLIDDFLFGVKLISYSKPDSKSDYFFKWGYYPDTSKDFPFITFNREYRRIDIKNKPRYVDTNQQGMEFGLRMQKAFNPYGFELVKTWVPFADKMFNDYRER